MDTVTRVQILDETDCIQHSSNTLRKSMDPIILPPTVGQTRFLQLWWGNYSRRRKTLNSNRLNSSKNWLCVISCPSGGVGKYGLILNWTVCVTLQSLKPFNRLQNNYLRYFYIYYQQNVSTNHIYLIHVYKDYYNLQ